MNGYTQEYTQLPRFSKSEMIPPIGPQVVAKRFVMLPFPDAQDERGIEEANDLKLLKLRHIFHNEYCACMWL